MEISMAAEPSSVRVARAELMRWFHEQPGTGDELAASIAIAVSEAVGNVVRHAYPGLSVGRVEVDAQFQGSAIVVNVSDVGTGMMAKAEREGGGLGLPVIGRVADGVTVVSDETGTRVTMRFEVDSTARRGSIFGSRQTRRFAVGAH